MKIKLFVVAGSVMLLGWLLSGAAQASQYSRSRAAREAFRQSQPCPANGRTHGACPGYVVDHIMPLACGGPDIPSNMQWQTAAEGKAKDRWERQGCSHGHRR